MASKIFMTGATGNIGSRILAEFLNRTDASFVLLVFGKTDEEAKNEVSSVLNFWGIDAKSESTKNRIEVVRGDISAPKLGISENDYSRIGENLTHAIHCAANIKLNLTIEEARKSILDGTKNVVAITEKSFKAGTFRRFNHFSTMEVAGNLSGTVGEEFLSDKKRKFLNTYEQAKAETEEYLEDLSKKENYPITVYRPSMVVGDAESGKALHFQSFYHMIDDLFLNPQAPIMPGHKDFIIDTIPISFIARAMFEIHDSEETVGKVYHLTSGVSQTMNLFQFAELLQKTIRDKTGKELRMPRFIAPWIIHFLNILLYPFAFGPLKRRIQINFIFLKFFFLHVHFDNTNMKKFMESRGVSVPNLRDYLGTLFSYYYDNKKETPLVK